MTRNVEMLVRVADAFGELEDEVIFVGGAVVELYAPATNVIDPAALRGGRSMLMEPSAT